MARLLIIDDESDFLSILALLVQRQGHEVVEASDGRQAVDLVAADADIDAVLTDQHMPLVSGVEVRDRLSVLRPGLPVCVWSSLPDPERSVVDKKLKALEQVLESLLSARYTDR